MGIWDSVRNAVDRVTGSSANVSLNMDSNVLLPGQSVAVRIAVKNGLSTLEARALLMEIESVETIDLPRHANWANVIGDAAEAASKKATQPKPFATQHTETIFTACVTVAPAMTLSPGMERTFHGSFRLPANVQPSYDGKYAKHIWRVRARLDVFGTDPSTGWLTFQVRSAL